MSGARVVIKWLADDPPEVSDASNGFAPQITANNAVLASDADGDPLWLPQDELPIDLTASGVIGPLPVAKGGTGAVTLTSHGVLIGQGTGMVTAVAALTNGQLLVGQTAADPLPKTLSGDATLDETGALTLANTAVSANSYGGAASVATFTVDAKGRLTAAGSTTISLTNSNLQAGTYSNITGVGTISTGTWQGTAVAVAYGGTGRNALTAHYLVVGNGTTAVTLVAPGTSGLPLLSGGAAADPDYGALDISTSAATGTLPVTKGGTGIASLTANRIPYGDGASAFQSSASLTYDGTTLTLAGKLNLGQATVAQQTNITTSVQIDASSGVITTQTANAASNGTHTFTVNNSMVTTASVIDLTLGAYSGTYGGNGHPRVALGTKSNGSFTVIIINGHNSNALNGTMEINFSLS